MQTAIRATWLGLAGVIMMTGCASMQPTPKDMTFFVTSARSRARGPTLAASMARSSSAAWRRPRRR